MNQGRRQKYPLVVAVLMTLLLFSTSNNQFFADDESEDLTLKQMLLMPGKVTLAHAEFENKCISCHVHFDKDNQSPLCIECHEVVQLDIKEKLGFHGRLSQENINNCSLCHTEHQGRSFDITGLDKDLFDHSKTDFPISGEHLGLACATCHQEIEAANMELPEKIIALPVDQAYRFKAFLCASCHEDYHKKELGDKCEDCHSEKGWNVSAFDHDKTEFKLSGKHKDTLCISCHVNNQFKKVAPECKSCHLATDSHLGVFGNKCQTCHDAEKWQQSSFDHSIDTEYKLIGKHQKVTCLGCHRKLLKPAKECIGCHLSKDIHQGVNGKKCQDCHNNNDWGKTDFKHKSPLTGKHNKISCDRCHTPGSKSSKVVKDRNCFDCHEPIDPHLGKLGERCQSCHLTESWKESVKFNHDFSDFPLTGSHQLLVCEACHVSSAFSNQSAACIGCHRADDYHEGALGNECESCHDTSVWTHWHFDHELQTEYPLIGAHNNLQCALCHDQKIPEPLKPDTNCVSCHAKDDVHGGGFGSDCQHCHNTEQFNESQF